MDTSLLGGPQLDASKFSDSDKRDISQFIEAETQKAKIQECELHCTVYVPSCAILSTLSGLLLVFELLYGVGIVICTR